jgi:hypothetical protein
MSNVKMVAGRIVQEKGPGCAMTRDQLPDLSTSIGFHEKHDAAGASYKMILKGGQPWPDKTIPSTPNFLSL